MPSPLVGSGTVCKLAFETPESSLVALGTLPGTTKPKQVLFFNGGLDGTRKLIPNPSIRPDGNRADPANGNISASGQISFVLSLEFLPFLTKWFTHNLAASGSGPYTSVCKYNIATAAGVFQSVTLQFQIATSIFIVFRGLRIKSLGLVPIISEGFFVAVCDVVGTIGEYVTTDVFGADTVTDWTSAAPIDFTQVPTLKIGTYGSQAAVGYLKSLQFDTQAHLQEDDYRAAGNSVRGGLAVGAVDVKTKAEMAVESATQISLAQGTPANPAFEANVSLGASKTFKILTPRTTAMKTLPKVKDDMGIFMPAEFTASYLAAEGTSITFTTVYSIDPAVAYIP